MASQLIGTPTITLAEGEKTHDVADFTWQSDKHTFSIQGICPAKLREVRECEDGFAEFLPAKICLVDEDGKSTLMWNFSKPFGFDFARAYLNDHWVDGEPSEPVITFSDRDRLIDVIPIKDLPSTTIILVAGTPTRTGGRNIADLVRMKWDLAEMLCLEPVFTPHEKKVSDKLYEKEREAGKAAREAARAERAAAQEAERKAREAARAERAAAQEAERKAREERRIEIMGRATVYGFLPDGKRLKGTPITGNEWEVCPDHHPCIEVESYDKTTKQVGKSLIFFNVSKKRGGQARKVGETEVSAEQMKSAASGIQVERQILVDFGDCDFRMVDIFASYDDVKKFRAAVSLNSGKLVGVQEGKKIHVYAFVGNSIEDRKVHDEA